MYEIQRYYDTNVMGTAILLEEMVKEPKLRPEMLVLSSSRSVYGEGAYIAASDEGSEGASRHYPASRSATDRSEEHTSELQSLMRISYAVFCLKKKKDRKTMTAHHD